MAAGTAPWISDIRPDAACSQRWTSFKSSLHNSGIFGGAMHNRWQWR